jgi:CDP-glucose 4,6-dehydratase
LEEWEPAVAAVVTPSVSFWSGRRVLVLGHTGFKGAWLSLWLRRLGAKVTGLSLPAPEASLFRACSLHDLVENRYADIRALRPVLEIFNIARPEIVFHLAAQSLVRPSYREPVETYATNVMGTVHVLAAANAAESVRSVIVVTSDKCYENREWLWPYREDEPMGGHDPYSSSKGCAELVAAAWRRSFCGPEKRQIGIASARAGNVIGGGDWAEDRIVPDCIRALSSKQVIGIRSPKSVRPWQHVLDPICGYLVLAERVTESPQRYAQSWNFGPPDDHARDVEWIANRIVGAWGEGARWQKIPADELHEASLLKVDSSKARASLGWSQRLSLEDTVDWTVTWYKRFINGHSALALTEGQIECYGELDAKHHA